MSPKGRSFPVLSNSFPRVSGDEPLPVRWLEDGEEFSPRERG